MKGIPNTLATRDDIDHLRGYMGTAWDTAENRAVVIAQLDAIRNTHWHYVFSRVLPTDADRAGPEPDCRVLSGQGADGSELHEFCLTVNPHSRLVTLGMTLEEMDALLAELVPA